MHKQNLVNCMYQKGLSKFTDFISIRIKFYIIFLLLCTSTCEWFMIQVPVSIDLMTVGFIVLLSVCITLISKHESDRKFSGRISNGYLRWMNMFQVKLFSFVL